MNNAVTLGESSRLMQDMSAVVDQELKGCLCRKQLEKLMGKSEIQDEGLDRLFEYVGDVLNENPEADAEANDALISRHHVRTGRAARAEASAAANTGRCRQHERAPADQQQRDE